MTPTDPDRLCRTCQGRLDADLSAVGKHPGCGASAPVSDRAEASLIAALAQGLGARRDPNPTSKEN